MVEFGIGRDGSQPSAAFLVSNPATSSETVGYADDVSLTLERRLIDFAICLPSSARARASVRLDQRPVLIVNRARPMGDCNHNHLFGSHSTNALSWMPVEKDGLQTVPGDREATHRK